MIDYAEYLLAEAESDVAALHQFKLLWDASNHTFHFFFEGEDDILFYMPEVRRHLLENRSANTYLCGGKKNVASVRDAIKLDGYDITYCFFFVDRDYDDYTSNQISVDEHTYMTDGYSIENCLVTIDNAKIIFEDIIRFSKSDAAYTSAITNLNILLENFTKIVRPLSAWMIAAKAEKIKPNFNNTKGLKCLIEIKNDGSLRIKDSGFSAFKRQTIENKSPPPFKSVIKWRKAILKDDPKKWIRGKYELWFFQEAIISIIDNISLSRKNIGKKPIKIPSALRDGRIFELLGGRIHPSDSLLQYLRKKLQ